MGASMARSSSSVTVLWLYAAQSRSLSAGSPSPASSRRRVISWRLGTRAFPPRSPNDTKPSAHGQISRVRPTAGPDRRPRKPGRAERPPAREAGTGEPAGGPHAGDEHDLLHGDVDALPPARRHPRERGEGGLRPG